MKQGENKPSPEGLDWAELNVRAVIGFGVFAMIIAILGNLYVYLVR